MAGPIPLVFDVTDALPSEVAGGRRIEIAAWLFVPDDVSKLGPSPVAMTLLHGGSYDKRYHDAAVPGRTGYSCARRLADLGDIVLLPDVLGVGESSRLPVQNHATRHIAALANHAAVTQFSERLRTGEVQQGLPALPNVVSIGGGHSMGGMLTMTQQAEHRTYAGVMIIGYTAVGVHRRVDGQLRPVVLGPPVPGQDYLAVDRAPLRETFHWPDTPPDVIAADDALAVEVPALLGRVGVEPGVVRADAARIETPVYIGLGERDNSPDPYAEPSCYRASRDITLHVLPRSAHCHVFAATRQQMWDRMHHWARGVATAASQPGASTPA